MAGREPSGIIAVAMPPTAECGPRARLNGQAVRWALGTGPNWSEPGAELASDRIVISTMNGRLVYRLGAHHPDEDVYDAEWPD